MCVPGPVSPFCCLPFGALLPFANAQFSGVLHCRVLLGAHQIQGTDLGGQKGPSTQTLAEKLQTFADSPLCLDIEASAGRKAAAENRMSGNRKRWRQTGVAAINPPIRGPIHETDPIRKFSIDPESTRTCKTQQNSLPKGSRCGISVSTPHRRYGHDCGRRFPDAISETSNMCISRCPSTVSRTV